MATARFYHGVQRYLLGFETFSRLLFYAACIAGLVFGILNNHWLAAGIALLIWLFAIPYRQSSLIGQPKKWAETGNISPCRFSISSSPTSRSNSNFTAPYAGKGTL